MAGHEPTPLRVHSVAEAYLYLKVSPCSRCGRGPLVQTTDLTRRGEQPGEYELATRCAACRESSLLSFIVFPPPTRESGESNIINATGERSAAIDLLGWLTLFRVILEASEKSADKSSARSLAWEAAQCLDEALKFYESENEMPPVNAFFSETSLQRYRERPQHFARSAWIERRVKLPNATVRTSSQSQRRWWQFWISRR